MSPDGWVKARDGWACTALRHGEEDCANVATWARGCEGRCDEHAEFAGPSKAELRAMLREALRSARAGTLTPERWAALNEAAKEPT